MTIAGVADTHAVLWYTYGDARLSRPAKAFIDSTAAAGNQIGLASVTLVEVVYLIEKRKIPVESLTLLATALSNPRSSFIEISLNLHVARTLSRIDVFSVPDMPDRIIAATALSLGVPIISRDAKIQTSGLATIW